MKRKAPPKDSPAEVARAAGCSRSLACRLLGRGLSRRQIVARIAENKRREAERALLKKLPATPVIQPATNGHAASDGLLSFAGAQCAKENWLAGLRRLEFQQKSGELLNAAEVKKWFLHWMVPLLQALRRLPGEMTIELQDKTALEIEQILRDRIEGCIRCVHDYWGLCFTRAGEPISDGSLDCGGGYKAVWRIEPPLPAAAKEPDEAA
jgi:hypothetical protein